MFNSVSKAKKLPTHHILILVIAFIISSYVLWNNNAEYLKCCRRCQTTSWMENKIATSCEHLYCLKNNVNVIYSLGVLQRLAHTKNNAFDVTLNYTENENNFNSFNWINSNWHLLLYLDQNTIGFLLVTIETNMVTLSIQKYFKSFIKYCASIIQIFSAERYWRYFEIPIGFI